MENNSNTGMKLLVAFLIFLYVVSPVDALPGPIDDVIVVLMGLSMSKHNKGGLWFWGLSCTGLERKKGGSRAWRRLSLQQD